MAYKGHMKGGVVVLDETADLPEGTRVDVRPVAPPRGTHHPDVERFAGVIPPDQEFDTGEAYLSHLRTKHQ
jgi:hypothetical protein